MANAFFTRTIFSLILAAVFAVVPVSEAAAEPGGLVIARDGIAVDGLALAKGRPIQVAALVDGKLSNEAVTWSSVPEGVLEVRDLGGGRAEVKALRDLFDNGGKEPRGMLRVCVGQSCASVGIVCLIDVAGRWHASAALAGITTAKDDFTLRQDGRRITYKDVVIKLEGTSLRLVSGGETLTRFNGTVTSGASANGTWLSTRGFGGTWSATK